MNVMIEAIFENGVLRPIAPIPGLADGQRVTVTIEDEAEIKKREEAFRRKVDEEGLIVHFPPPAEKTAANFTPIKVSGKPISETIIEERR
jgi:predicted DNA-binding antitoxin AbrB/MazE fold protein